MREAYGFLARQVGFRDAVQVSVIVPAVMGQ